MKSRYIAFGAVILGAAIQLALFQVSRAAFWDGFELPPGYSPTYLSRLAWLWTTLIVILPGVVIGILVSRHAAWLSGLAYLLAVVADFCYHDGERLVPHEFAPHLKDPRIWPSLLSAFLIFAVVGGIVGLAAAWLRRRLTIGSSDRGVASSVSHGGDR
jgi:hypothetical protein